MPSEHPPAVAPMRLPMPCTFDPHLPASFAETAHEAPAAVLVAFRAPAAGSGAAADTLAVPAAVVLRFVYIPG